MAGALLALGLLAGCASNNTPTPLPTATLEPTVTPLPRGGNLTIRAADEVAELRPWQPRTRAEEQVIELMYSGLTYLDDKLQPRPDLAERWDTSADGRLITFTLRTNLTWHDGTPVTSDDVAYTLGELRTISPTTSLLADLRARVAQVTPLNASTVEISLTERYAPIFAELAVPILPKHLLNGKSIAELNFWDAPVGSGPFKLEERKPGQSISLAANPLFYRGPPLLDRVVFAVAPDAAVAAKAMADGQLLLAELPADSRPITATVPDARVGEYAENGYYFLGFNTRQGRPFADAQVRNALAKAIDMPALVHEATGGVGRAIGSDAAPGSWADVVPPPTSTVDLAQARALLDEAGWRMPEGGTVRQRDGKPLAAQIFVRGDDQRRIKAANLIAKAAATVGISLTVQPADFETVLSARYMPPYDFDLLLGSWVGGAGDPSFGDYLFYDPDNYALFHSSQINQGVADTRAALNFVGFSDAVYENQVVAARQIYDSAQRTDALQRAQQRISELKPYLFLWSDRRVAALSAKVTTLDGPINMSTPLYLWNIERWHLVK